MATQFTDAYMYLSLDSNKWNDKGRLPSLNKTRWHGNDLYITGIL